MGGVSEGVRDREGLGECDSDEETVSEGVREGNKEGVRVGVLVAEGDADSDVEDVSDGEGVGDTGTYEIEKTGSPCAFVAMSMGLVNWMSVVVFAGTATPVDVKSM